MTEFTRVALLFDKDGVERLNRMQEMAGLNNGFLSFLKRRKLKARKRLFNEALALLRWAIRQRKEGREIVSVDEKAGAYKGLSMPVLDAIEPQNGFGCSNVLLFPLLKARKLQDEVEHPDE